MLPTNYQQFYVYRHIDPDMSELLYVGAGSTQRAWMCLGGYSDTKYGHRSPEHASHIKDMMSRGYLPCDWVEIVHRGLSKGDAVRREQAIIRAENPKYNRPLGKKIIKMDDKMVSRSLELRRGGKSYSKIATEVGVSTMTGFRALNGQTKNIEVA